MNKIILIITCLLIQACNTEIPDNHEREKIIVSGQSNAVYCDWSYFESISNYDVVIIAKSGYSIQMLVDDYLDNNYETSGLKMIFVHGERDAMLETSGEEYISKVHEYQNLTGVSEVYFSLVGYRSDYDKDWSFVNIREAVKKESSNVDYWFVGYEDAYTFRDRALLRDKIHFKEQGCREMMFSISQSL